MAPFYRMGEPVRVPVSPTSGSSEYVMSPPTGATCFIFTNPNLFACRLRGRRTGGTFTAVTSTTGWLILPGVMGPLGTLSPISLSAMSVDGPAAGYLDAAKAGSGFLELQYGVV